MKGISMITCTLYPKYRYSGLSTDEKPVHEVRDASTFWETDTGRNFEMLGGEWIEDKSITEVNDAFAVVVYIDGNNLYICRAAPGTPQSSSNWQIKRVNTDSLAVTWAYGSNAYAHAVSDKAAVLALPYS